MKFSSVAATTALLSSSTAVSAYTVGFGFGPRPLIVRGLNRNNACGPGGNCNDEFDVLRNEFGASPRRRARRRRFAESNSPSLDRQREMIKQAFDLATEFMDEANTSKNFSKDFIDRAFGVVNDVSAGRSSPRYEVSNEEDAFLLAVDVPGISSKDLDLSVNQEEQTLTISGKRTVGRGDNARVSEFSKTFTVDESAMLDQISAKLQNGVLAVTVPKQPPKAKEETIKKIPITIAEDEVDEAVVEEELEVVDTVSTDSPAAEESNAEFEDDKDEKHQV